MSTLWCVGDSWSAGWAGASPTGEPRYFSHTMCTELAQRLELECVNFSVAGASIGHIVDIYMRRVSTNIKQGDTVFLCAPPDSRYHRLDLGMISTAGIHNPAGQEYLLDLLKHNGNDTTWFKWHYAVFSRLIYTDAISKGAECYVQHNYGTIPDFSWFDQGIFLSNNSMWEWIGLPPIETFMVGDDGPNGEHLSEYMEIAHRELCHMPDGNLDYHPNQRNQRMIGNRLADMIQERRK